MKYVTRKLEGGEVQLQLGLNHFVTYAPDANVEAIVAGVENLINNVVGVSAFELCAAVMKEFSKDDG